MMRASGAIPIMTALQMAAASLAVPKSDMKTMVGFRAAIADTSFGAGAVAHPACIPAKSRASTRQNRGFTLRDIVFPLIFAHLVYAFRPENLAWGPMESVGTVALFEKTSDRKSTRLNSSHIPLSRMP